MLLYTNTRRCVMVSIQEKIRNLSMGIAVSSIMSTGAAQAQEQHQPDKFPQTIEKTDEWQRVIMPEGGLLSSYPSKKEALQAFRQHTEANGDLYWCIRGMANASNEEKEKFLNSTDRITDYSYNKDGSTRYGLPIRTSPPTSALIPSQTVQKIKQQENISILNSPDEMYLYLQKEDYLKASRFDASKNIAQKCIVLYKDSPEKVDKILPNLSNYINQYSEDIHINEYGAVMPTQEVTDTVQKHILKNFNKIAPDFDKQMEAKYNERDPNTVTLKKMTPEAFYVLAYDWSGYISNFNSPKIAADVQRIADIMNIEPDPLVQTQQKTVDNHQENQTSTADKISELRGTNSISDSKKNIKNSWQQIKQNVNNAKNSFNNI